MTKKFFYFAFAAMTAMCLTTACSSDDKEDDVPTPDEATLPVPQNASNAVQYSFSTPMASTTSTTENAPTIKTIDITESSEILLELRNKEGKTFYVKDKVTVNGNEYTFNGDKIKGTIRVIDADSRQTRAGSTALEIDITVTVSATEVYTYKNEEGEVVTKTKPITGDAIMDNLARTWKIEGVILDLVSDKVKAYEKWDAVGGVFDMETTVLKEALEQGVELTKQEQEDLKRKVTAITFTKTGLFTIDYVNVRSDVASWKWANSQKTQFKITLKDKDMGNKFIDNNSSVDFAFNGDRCNMKLSTVFRDSSNKEWNISLTLRLKP